MRHYVELPRRLPSARSIARTRSRALPVLLALPLVALLWITIGLPMLSDATTASASDLRTRETFLHGLGSAAGGSRSGDEPSQTVAVATFSPAALRSAGLVRSSTPFELSTRSAGINGSGSGAGFGSSGLEAPIEPAEIGRAHV